MSGSSGRTWLLIATGGINRHNGIIEGREFGRQLTEAGVPGNAIRVEDQSKDTWQNVELSLPYLREALAMGLRLAAVTVVPPAGGVLPGHPACPSGPVLRHLVGAGIRRHAGHERELAEDPRRSPPRSPRVPRSAPPGG